MGTARVTSVNISEEKGTVKKPVPEMQVDENGVVGDAHAGAWHRQVSVLSSEIIRDFEKEMGREIKPGEFAENLTTEGIDLHDVAVLDCLTVGGTKLQVTQIGKECHGATCAIFREVGKCVMPHEGIFCRVVSGGKITAGDPMELSARPFCVRVITMSDRAHSGEYEDRSGPKIVEILEEFFKDKRWHLEVSAAVLPDDAEQLRDAVTQAQEDAVDVLITTGGTGVGPRDITPDVVLGMIDKEIPGIMENIRIRFGSEKPGALLSRGVAGVMGQTQVYTLPGSVKAVTEYMGEILKTLEHLVRMLHAIDTH